MGRLQSSVIPFGEPRPATSSTPAGPLSTVVTLGTALDEHAMLRHGVRAAMPSPISPAIHPWIERLNLAFGTSKASSRSRRAPPYASPDCGLGAPRLRSVGDKEISATVELSVGGGLVPLQGKLAATMTHRFGKRALEALEPSLTAIGDARLIDRLAGNEELDVLVVRGECRCYVRKL